MYGFQRVISPKGVVPQAADEVDNTPKILDSTEVLISVDCLNLDSTSMRQLWENEEFYKDPMETSEQEVDVDAVKQKILSIADARGKMHNPVTNSGGVLVGKIIRRGHKSVCYEAVARSKFIIPLVSLSAIPLKLIAVKSIDGDMVRVEGKAILFNHYPFVVVPDDMSVELALSAIDISSIVPQVERLIAPRMKMLVIGCGKAGLTAMAVARRRYKDIQINAADYCEDKLFTAKRLGYADYYWRMDATDAEQVYEFTKRIGFDLVINCVNAPNTETGSIIATRPGGTVIFFSMATAFHKAALGTDAIGKDVTMIIGNGIADNQAEKMFDLLRSDRGLRRYFKSLHGGA